MEGLLAVDVVEGVEDIVVLVTLNTGVGLFDVEGAEGVADVETVDVMLKELPTLLLEVLFGVLVVLLLLLGTIGPSLLSLSGLLETLHGSGADGVIGILLLLGSGVSLFSTLIRMSSLDDPPSVSCCDCDGLLLSR